MPYIEKYDRNILDSQEAEPDTPGELNYVITTIILRYLEKIIPIDIMRDKNSYTDYNEVIGVLECVKQEFYRRKIVPYENQKIEENSDVY